MKLLYISQPKQSKNNKSVFIGGIVLEEKNITAFENSSKFSRNNIFSGYKVKSKKEKKSIFKDIVDFLVENKIPILIVCIDTDAVKIHYKKKPFNPYCLGIVFILEKFNELLGNDIGLVFTCKESYKRNLSDEMKKIKSLSKKKIHKIKDTVYSIHSHYSMFLQVAKVVTSMASKYEKKHNLKRNSDKEVQKIWENIKKNSSCKMKTFSRPRVSHWRLL